MDYLQYKSTVNEGETVLFCFKPYYKWITFNIFLLAFCHILLIGFKPYYKWITFNISHIQTYR